MPARSSVARTARRTFWSTMERRIWSGIDTADIPMSPFPGGKGYACTSGTSEAQQRSKQGRFNCMKIGVRRRRELTRSFPIWCSLLWYGHDGGVAGVIGGQVRDDLPAP